MLSDFAISKCEECFYADLDKELAYETDLYEKVSIYFTRKGYETFGNKLNFKIKDWV